MMSVPSHWSEFYFNVFAILCVGGWLFLIWYEITRRGEQSGYIDVAMNVALGAGSVGLAAALLTFVILKARDGIMMTWERYREIRFEAGREQGREEGIEQGREEGREQALHEVLKEMKQALYQNGSAEVRDQLDRLEATEEDPMEEIKQILVQEGQANRELLEKILASLGELAKERSR